MEFMNVSGQPVARVAKFWKIAPTHIVVHDDLDLPFGRLRLGAGGGHGRQQRRAVAAGGARHPDFLRVRFGVGRPAGGDAANYVLADFSRAEQKELPDLRIEAANAVEEISPTA